MTPEIRYIVSVDVVGALEEWKPSDPAFSVDLDVFAGPAGTEVAERFTLYVCSPAWLEKSIEDRGPLDGRHMFIVKEFDYPRIRAWIDSVVEDSTGADWDEVAAKLGRYFAWEFEPGTYVWSPAEGDIDTRISGEPDT
jgi:hypothetical protein